MNVIDRRNTKYVPVRTLYSFEIECELDKITTCKSPTIKTTLFYLFLAPLYQSTRWAIALSPVLTAALTKM